MAVFLYILLMVINFIVRIVCALIKRVNLTNSLFIGVIPVFLVRNKGFDKMTNWIIFGIAVLLALVIQHMFTIAKILAALFSSVIQAIRHPITRMLHIIPHNNVCHQGKLTLPTAIATTLAVKSLATIP